MTSVWGVDHGDEVSKKNQQQFSTRDKHLAEGVGAAAAGGLAVKYGTGARALSRLNPERAASVGRAFAHHEGHDFAGHLEAGDPLHAIVRSAANNYKQQYRNATELNAVNRKAMAGAARWEKGPGMQEHRKLMNSKSKLVKLHPRYADHKVFSAAVHNAPRTDKRLYRSVHLNNAELAQAKRGHRVDRGIQSWTDSPSMARLHGEGANTPQGRMALGAKSFEGKHNKATFVMHPGHRALNIQGMGRMSQREYVSDKPFKVKGSVQGTNGDGDFIHVRPDVPGRQATRGNVKRKVGQSRVQKSLTPLQAGRPRYLQDTLSGKFIRAGKHQNATILVGKRMMSDSELRRRKKLQAGIAVTTSTLGLTALGTKGAATVVGRAAGKAGKLAQTAATPGERLSHGVREAKLTRVSRKLDNAALNTSLVSGGIGGVGGYNFASYTRAEGKKRQGVAKNDGGVMDFGLSGVQQGEEISKKQDWKNISEHERRARDSRRHQRGATSVMGAGTTVGAGAILHGAFTGRDVFGQGHAVGRATKNTGKAYWAMRGVKGPAGAQVRSANLKALTSTIKANPHGSVALAGYGTAGLALGAKGAMRANEARHHRAIARQRRQRAVAKAYDPERNRQKRLQGYQNATMFGAGVTGAAAIHQGRGAIGHREHEEWRTKKNVSRKVTVEGTGLHSPSGAVVRGSFKKLGKAGALGVGAAGLAMGSQRIGSYRKGRGRSYSPLRTIGY